MAKHRTLKSVVDRCRECGSTSNEAFLERIKGSKQYICDECASDHAFQSLAKHKRPSHHYFDDELSDNYLFI